MWGDLDSLGIVFYPRYYEWMDSSGHLFFESIGLNLGNLWKEKHIQFGLVETYCRYLRPGKYHQELEIKTHIEELSRKTVSLKHELRRADDKTLMVEGREKRICMDVSDPENFQAIEIPQDIYDILKRTNKSRM
jgi:YbgC/YbaW family acyl-CoA thioester hydrolase